MIYPESLFCRTRRMARELQKKLGAYDGASGSGSTSSPRKTTVIPPSRSEKEGQPFGVDGVWWVFLLRYDKALTNAHHATCHLSAYFVDMMVDDFWIFLGSGQFWELKQKTPAVGRWEGGFGTVE